MKRFFPFSAMLIVIGSFFGANAAEHINADESQTEERLILRLPAGPVHIAPGIQLAHDVSDDSPCVFIVLPAAGTPAMSVRRAIADAGAERLHPIPGGAFLIRATAIQIRDIAAHVNLIAARPYLPQDKSPPPAEQEAVYVVSFLPGADAAHGRTAIADLDGCVPMAMDDAVFRVRMTPAGHAAACALPDVESITQWIEPTP